jgi:hypothetical protein
MTSLWVVNCLIRRATTVVKLDIKQAAERLGISEQTVRRRLHSGLLNGYQEDPPQGRWWVELAEEDLNEDQNGSVDVMSIVAILQAQLSAKDQQLAAKDEQIRELHILLQQAQATLPAPRENHSWWRFWQR